jgi:hypothetical protein
MNGSPLLRLDRLYRSTIETASINVTLIGDMAMAG